MASSEPLISILMAVYEPPPDWLREQLISLNVQNYPNLRLYIRDDASHIDSFALLQRMAASCITAFPYTVQRNERNLGSNETFQRLTEEAEGDYFAYCDQDDVWLPHKITAERAALESTGALLVCADAEIIDANGRKKADSIKRVRRHHRFYSGSGLASRLLVSNFAIGCTLLVRAEQAKAALPFCPYMVHDQYLAFFCATKGDICSISSPLIRYRIHGVNQTLGMPGVHDRGSYYKLRVEQLSLRLEWLQERYGTSPELAREIALARAWIDARKRNFLGDKSARKIIWKYRRFSPLTSLFELVMVHAPEKLFMFFVILKRNNII